VTLLDGVADLLAYERVNGAKLSIINRLDRETSGIVLLAKHKTAARELNRAMERREIKKYYHAVVYGKVPWISRKVNAPIGNQRDVMESKIWLKQMVTESGKEAITEIENLGVFGDFSLLKIKPKTGRMHQIRVHCFHLGYPIVGDKIYGLNENFYIQHIEQGWTEELAKQLLMPRHALHNSGLEVKYQGNWLQFECPIPDSFTKFLNGH